MCLISVLNRQPLIVTLQYHRYGLNKITPSFSLFGISSSQVCVTFIAVRCMPLSCLRMWIGSVGLIAVFVDGVL